MNKSNEKLGCLGTLFFASIIALIWHCIDLATKEDKPLLEQKLERAIENDRIIREAEADIRFISISAKMRIIEDKIERMAIRLENTGYLSDESLEEWSKLEKEHAELVEERKRLKEHLVGDKLER